MLRQRFAGENGYFRFQEAAKLLQGCGRYGLHDQDQGTWMCTDRMLTGAELQARVDVTAQHIRRMPFVSIHINVNNSPSIGGFSPLFPQDQL